MSDDCGIGTPQDHQGACTGTLRPSDAGQGVFDGVSASPVVHGFVGAAGLLAGLLFVVFVVRFVGGFFGGKRKVLKARGGSFSDAVEEHLREHPESESFSALALERVEGKGDANDLDGRDGETELDREDDTEEGEDEADQRTDSPGYQRKFQ